MTTTNQLIADFLRLQQKAMLTIVELHKPTHRPDMILYYRSEMEHYIKDMKATYFDLMEVGGPPEFKVLITTIMKDYEAAPFFDALPGAAEIQAGMQETGATATEDVNGQRMLAGDTPREELDPYVPLPSTLNFARGDVIRTPIKNKRNQNWPAWFYVSEVLTTDEGVKLKGWRLGEYDQRFRHKYRDVRVIVPDQYTYIDKRGVGRADVGIDDV